MTTATAKDLRHRAGALLAEVRRGRQVVITFRGKSIAVLAPLERFERKEVEPVGFGMWRGRNDMRRVAHWLDDVRRPRHGR